MTANRKVGLVLSGGGGKGAYQIGCWEALREAGIQDFEIISGTSVGALNAALIGIGDLDRAKAVWRTLSEPKVLLTTNLRKLVVGAVFGVTTVAVTLLELLFGAALIIAPMLGGPIWLVFASSYRVVGGQETYSPVPIADWMTAHPWLVLALICYEGFLVWVLIYGLVSGTVVVGRRQLQANAKSIAVAMGRYLWVGSISPLKKLIRAYVTLDDLRRAGTRVFATIAVQRTLLDPYRGNWLVIEGPDDHKPWRGLQYRLLPEPGWYSGMRAESVEVSALTSDEDIVDALSASAQLPLVFRPGQWVGKLSFDGGLAENTPVWPAVQHCDVVIVVYLDYANSPSMAVIEAGVADMYYAEMLSRLSAAEAQLIYSEFARLGKFAPPAPPVRFDEKRVILVIPSEPLGSTVDFSGGRRVERLIALGKRDMEQALQAHQLFQ